MIDIKNVSYEVNGHELLNGVDFVINPGDKIGLVGPNGSGKTTLLKIISGEILPTSGKVIASDHEVGLLPQRLDDWLDSSVYQFVEEVSGVKSARQEFEAQCQLMADQPGGQAEISYLKALERYDRLEVAWFEANLKKALDLVGLDKLDVDRKLKTFSGGQRVRVALAAILASKYDLILLDESTNSLDKAGFEILEKYINDSQLAFLMVSHDRRFLRNSTEKIIELKPSGGVSQYSLGYDEYIEARTKDRQSAIDRYEKYQKDKKRLEKTVKQAKIRANSANNNRNYSDNDKMTRDFYRERATFRLSGAANSLESRLNRLEEPEVVDNEIVLNFHFDESSSKKHSLLRVDSLVVSYDGKSLFGPLSVNLRAGDKVLLQGENGSGKSSLLRAINGEKIIHSGEVRLKPGLARVYIDQEQDLPLKNASALDNILYISPHINLSRAINLLVQFGVGKQAIYSVPAKDLSGGERAKILLATIAAGQPDLLILDEPTNNLDIPTIEALESALRNYRGGVLLVSHDREFVERLGIDQVIGF